MISVTNLSYAYPGQPAIRFADFACRQGEHLLLLGESGSGKTTLLHLLGGLLRIQQGVINIDGTNLATLTERQLDAFRGKNFGFIFQKNHLVSALPVKKNLDLASYLAGKNADTNRSTELLGLLGMQAKAGAHVRTLSQGQAQRVAIARAVMNQPSIILADEPTSALDDKNCYRVIDLLLEVARQSNATLVIATHDHRLTSKISNHLRLAS
jgi:putative ABC transport system ATP-binding protein